ncbi:benzoate 4-monooxygenase cytochrome P450 [Aspergillus heteromorphus CBS 117.55]|uniref:Benzoate 4-monooxygenase cytochrome P450 n=1 Tax=Aspergillus heteromorphus CBS 117.55 TaxID=1448321 RepID=A0A317W671_9EURO|nr:benzoate 4-monooxygenase cytochrome P450 [Aspergillus heteromorphus CBS 117.55]PWY82104.1 benzoate 4-monooxygenase cytochrome P450 [Aspergillus heteromorphus CBS 117.55]
MAIHRGLFIHGEWHIQAPTILLAHLGVFALVIVCYHVATEHGDTFSYDVPCLFAAGYLVSLFASMTVYRVFFHRLSGFDGPFWARITKLWHVWKVRDAQNHVLLGGLHERYGDFIRTGPSEITVVHPDAFMVVDGPQTKCIKAEWYDLLHPGLALVTTRDKKIHAARRRQWNRGFSSQSLRQYEEKVLFYLGQLDEIIEREAQTGQICEMTDLFYWFGFDAMGDFVFNKSFDMLHDQQWHHMIVILQRALDILGPLSPVPWLIQIAFKFFPNFWVIKYWFTMKAWCEEQMRERMQMNLSKDPSRVPDVAHYLTEDVEESTDSWTWLSGDSILAIVAGSEPTAAVLVGLFSCLARHPIHAETIHAELPGVDITDPIALSKRCPHLEATIMEALRLFPALPTAGLRKTLDEGVVIAGRYIPPQTTIVAPRWLIVRREDCFTRATEFIPERWYKHPEMVRNKAAYNPFGLGHNSCLGKTLATDYLRLVTARLVSKYHIRLPEGETTDEVVGDLRDRFASRPGRLRLRLEVR